MKFLHKKYISYLIISFFLFLTVKFFPIFFNNYGNGNEIIHIDNFYEQNSLYFLDAGHGKGGSVCYEYKTGEKYCEWEFTASVVERLQKKLDSVGIFSIRTDTLTRQRNLKLKQRINWVNEMISLNEKQFDSFVLISIHSNFSKKSSSNGTEILINTNKYRDNAKDLTKILFLCEQIKEGYDSTLGFNWRKGDDNFYKNDSEGHYNSLAITSKTSKRCLSIITETGFISNNHEREIMKQKIDVIADIYLNSILKFEQVY